jgi:hypothetical protein
MIDQTDAINARLNEELLSADCAHVSRVRKFNQSFCNIIERSGVS